MADGDLILDVDYNITKAEAKQRKLNADFEQSKKKAQAVADAMENTTANIEESRRKQKELIREYEATKQKMTDFEQKKSAMTYKSYQTEVKKSEKILDTIDREEKKEQSLQEKLTKQNLQLDAQNAKTKQIGDNIALNSQKTAKSAKRMSKSFRKSIEPLDKLQKRLIRLASRVLIFSVFTRALRGVRKEFANLVKETPKFSEKLAEIKGNLQVINRSIVIGLSPLISYILNSVSKLTSIFAKVMARAIGKDAKQMAKLAKNTDKVKGSAEKALASFDTLQKIDTSGGGGADSGEIQAKYDDGITKYTESQLDAIMGIAGLSLVAIGLILIFTGHLGLGLGAVIAGSVFMFKSAELRQGEAGDGVTKGLDAIMGIIGGAMFVIGIVLLFMGHIPLGVGAMIAGSAGIINAVQPKWNALDEPIQTRISALTALIGTAMLVIGVILLFTGHIPLGVGAVIAGIAGMVAPAVLQWDKMSEDTKAFMADMLGIVGSSLIVIGIILLATGVGIPIGLSLLLTGVAGLAGSVALNWDFIVERCRQLKDRVLGVFNEFKKSAKDGWKAVLNFFIDEANSWINRLNRLLRGSGEIVEKIAKAFGGSVNTKGWKIPNIPRLAKGDVIAGGSPFLAVLGDQPKGQTNIETPLDTMIEAFKTAFEEVGGKGTTIRFEGNLAQLARVLNPVIEEEKKRATAW